MSPLVGSARSGQSGGGVSHSLQAHFNFKPPHWVLVLASRAGRNTPPRCGAQLLRGTFNEEGSGKELHPSGKERTALVLLYEYLYLISAVRDDIGSDPTTWNPQSKF